MGYIEETGESFGLTSMLKQVDAAIYYFAVKAAVEGTFKGGVEVFGLDRFVTIGGITYSGVNYAIDEFNVDLISAEMIAKVEEAKAKIISGEIVVPTEVTK